MSLCYWNDLQLVVKKTPASAYEVQVAKDAAFATLLTSRTGLAATSRADTLSRYERSYYWRLRGVNGGGAGPWSAGQQLTTGEAPPRRYYVTDPLGSVRAVVDATGEVKEARDYYPFGLRMPGRVTTEGTPAREDFTGHERDAATGLHYAGARYYMSAFGRWTTTDPLADDSAQRDLSPYQYSWNNPVNITDPDGQCPWCVGAIVGAAVEFGSQAAINYANGQSFTEAVGNVDYTDVAISAGAGALTGGLSTLKNVGTAGKAAISVAASVGEGASKANFGNRTSNYNASDAVIDGALGAGSFAFGEAAEVYAKGTKEGQRLGGIARRAESRAQRAPSNMNIKHAKRARMAAATFTAARGELAGGGVRAAGTGVVIGTDDSGKQGSVTIFLINTGGNSNAPADNTRVAVPIRQDDEQR